MRAERCLAIAALAIGLSACDMVYSPTAPSREWSTHDSARFTIHAKPGSFADANAAAMIEILDDQYAVTSQLFGFPDGQHVWVFLYNRGSELTPPLPEARSGVAFPDTNALHAVAAAPMDDNLRTLLAHEVNHIVLINGLGRAGTSFMNEGLASAVISEHLAPIGRTALSRWARTNSARLPRLAELIDDSKWNSNSNTGYNTSAAFLSFLLDRYGVAAMRRVYYARSSEFAARVAETYGKPLGELEAEWLATI